VDGAEIKLVFGLLFFIFFYLFIFLRFGF
jgi:hypothetical protein